MAIAVKNNSTTLGADEAAPDQELLFDNDFGMHEVEEDKLNHIGIDGPEDLQTILWLKRAEQTRKRLARAG